MNVPWNEREVSKAGEAFAVMLRKMEQERPDLEADYSFVVSEGYEPDVLGFDGVYLEESEVWEAFGKEFGETVSNQVHRAFVRAYYRLYAAEYLARKGLTLTLPEYAA